MDPKTSLDLNSFGIVGLLVGELVDKSKSDLDHLGLFKSKSKISKYFSINQITKTYN
jgi:hypothetical protein